MKKTIKLILKLCSIISGAIFIGLGFSLNYLMTDKSGPYVETPFVIGGLFLVGVICILFWLFSMNFTVSNFLDYIAILFFSIAMYFSFTPVITGSNLFLSINSGNIFTFYTDKAYDFISQSKIATQAQHAYQFHIFIVIVLICLSVCIIIFKKNFIKKINTVLNK